MPEKAWSNISWLMVPFWITEKNYQQKKISFYRENRLFPILQYFLVKIFKRKFFGEVNRHFSE